MSSKYTLTIERDLCPNEQNGVTFEALGCMLNMTKYWDEIYYNCEDLGGFYEISKIQLIQQLTCQLLDVYKKCGEKMSTLLCKLFHKYKYMDRAFNWGDWSGNCDSYMDERCQCS